MAGGVSLILRNSNSNSLGAFLGWGCFTPPFANYLQSLNKWLLK